MITRSRLQKGGQGRLWGAGGWWAWLRSQEAKEGRICSVHTLRAPTQRVQTGGGIKSPPSISPVDILLWQNRGRRRGQ